MAKQTVTLHMYECTEDWRAGIKTVDQYDYRKLPECLNGKVWIGQVDVEIDFPEIDIVPVQIEMLQAEIQKERADSQVRVNLLIERMSKLQAIGHEVAE